MADTKVQLVVNEEQKQEVVVSEITSVEIRGATGVATYRLDPMQDTVIKLVVVGKVVPEEGNGDVVPQPVSSESVVAHLGKPEDVKALKEREAKVAKDAEEANKAAAEPQKDQKEAPAPEPVGATKK